MPWSLASWLVQEGESDWRPTVSSWNFKWLLLGVKGDWGYWFPIPMGLQDQLSSLNPWARERNKSSLKSYHYQVAICSCAPWITQFWWSRTFLNCNFVCSSPGLLVLWGDWQKQTQVIAGGIYFQLRPQRIPPCSIPRNRHLTVKVTKHTRTRRSVPGCWPLWPTHCRCWNYQIQNIN